MPFFSGARAALRQVFRKGSLKRNVALVAGGNAANYAGRFIVLALLARVMGPDRFGVFSVAYASLYIARFMVGLGLQVGAVRHATPQYQADGDNLAGDFFFRTLFAVRITVGSVIVLLALAGGSLVAEIAVGAADRADLVVVVGAGGALWSLADVPLAMFQAKERFRSYAIMNVFQGFALLAGVTALVVGGQPTMESALLVAIGAPPFAALVVIPLWAGPLVRARGRYGLALRQIFSVGKWVMVSNTLTTFMGRLPVIMLGVLSASAQVGYYSAAASLSAALALLATPIFTTVFPKVLSLDSVSQLRIFMNRMRKTVFWGSCLLVLIGVVAVPLILPVIYGKEYDSAIVAALILWGANVINMNYSFLSPVFYRYDQPWIVTAVQATKLVVLLGGFYILIPRVGAVGAAAALLVTHVVALTMYELIMRIIIRQGMSLPGSVEESTP